MPKKPVKRKIRSVSGTLTVGCLEQLLMGYEPFFEKPLTDDELEAEYTKNRDFILSLAGQNVRKLVPGWFLRPIPIPWGTRPAAWWQFEATEGRRMISGDPRNILPASPLWLGIPRLYTRHDHGCRFERQSDYLKRLSLLMDGEAEKIKPELINR